MYGLIWFLNQDGTIDTSHQFFEADTKEQYDDEVHRLESCGYVKGVDFR